MCLLMHGQRAGKRIQGYGRKGELRTTAIDVVGMKVLKS